MSQLPLSSRLENYTLRHPDEVLLVQAQIESEADQVVIFRGFSSSLMRPTAFDPEVPVLPDAAVIEKIDRLKGPYLPDAPEYLEEDISLRDFVTRLNGLGL